jgi:hypothetical protein
MDLGFDIKNSSYDNLTIILKPGALSVTNVNLKNTFYYINKALHPKY